MMKQEFENITNIQITQEEYNKVETVYLSYPGIRDKDHIARLYVTFGMNIIDDMYLRAITISEAEDRVSRRFQELEEAKKELHNLKTIGGPTK